MDINTNKKFNTTKIASIRPIGKRDVWDVTVEDDHSYIGNGIVNHNSGPNMQNLTPYLRGILVARPGYTFVNFDLSQAEVRVVAIRSGDEALIEAIRTADSGEAADIHCAVAAKMYKIDSKEVKSHQRRAAKTIVFGILYGLGKNRLGLALGISDEEAQNLIDEFFETYPRVKEWIDNQKIIASKPPYYVTTSWGTRRSTRNIKSISKKISMHYERIASNMSIQGDAGEFTLWLICEMMRYIRKNGIDAHMVNTTHDSVTFEVIADSAEKIKTMINTIVNKGAPVEPLNNMKFKCDIDEGTYWYGKPDALKAIDPDYGSDKSKIRFDLITLDLEELDKEEVEELLEIEVINAAIK